jgi:hypothetical protein
MSTLQILVTLSDILLLVYFGMTALCFVFVHFTKIGTLSEKFYSAITWPYFAFGLVWSFRFAVLLVAAIILKLIGYVLL